MATQYAPRPSSEHARAMPLSSIRACRLAGGTAWRGGALYVAGKRRRRPGSLIGAVLAAGFPACSWVAPVPALPGGRWSVRRGVRQPRRGDDHVPHGLWLASVRRDPGPDRGPGPGLLQRHVPAGRPQAWQRRPHVVGPARGGREGYRDRAGFALRCHHGRSRWHTGRRRGHVRQHDRLNACSRCPL